MIFLTKHTHTHTAPGLRWTGKDGPPYSYLHHIFTYISICKSVMRFSENPRAALNLSHTHALSVLVIVSILGTITIRLFINRNTDPCES